MRLLPEYRQEIDGYLSLRAFKDELVSLHNLFEDPVGFLLLIPLQILLLLRVTPLFCSLLDFLDEIFALFPLDGFDGNVYTHGMLKTPLVCRSFALNYSTMFGFFSPPFALFFLLHSSFPTPLKTPPLERDTISKISKA